jgi:protein-L-isoaspartate(D-aspartate) O-methyltransferase
MTEACDRLLKQIADEVQMTARELGVSGLDQRVTDALVQVPRERFVPEQERQLAYLNRPLPIGGGQTISQPYIVAIMSQLLEVGPGDRVFELGTGSGYQAAILAAMGVEVYSVEIVPELAARAAATLAALGAEKVQVRAGDGWLGWPEAAPFDGIIVTAAAPHLPRHLIEQLKPGGRLLIPMGGVHAIQQLALCEKDADGQLHRRNLLAVRFVPVTGSMAP